MHSDIVHACIINTALLDDEIQQSLALRWLSDFLNIVPEVMVPFTPRLVEVILPNIARDITIIQLAAQRTNKLLFDTIQALPPPTEPPTRQSTDKTISSGPSQIAPGSPTPTIPSLGHTRPAKDLPAPPKDVSLSESQPDPSTSQPNTQERTYGTMQRPRSSLPLDQTRGSNLTQGHTETTNSQPSRPESPTSVISIPHAQTSPEASMLQEKDRDLFDYQATVNVLRERFICEHEDTRVASLKWLIMLHQKAPKKVRCHLSRTSCPLTQKSRSSLWTMELSLRC